ncbi:MAG: NADH-quinone oxidoreductase subunit NuoK [Paracoccaceae bacterium]
MTEAAFLGLLAVAGGLFAIGLAGLVLRRTVLFQLLALEVMLSGPALAFVAAGARHGAAEGQAMTLLVIALAAAEVALGLALFLRLRRGEVGTDADAAATLRH